MPARYAELHALSNFTFLRGASHPEELVETAASLGYEALAITDECSMSGIVRAHAAAREYGLNTRFIELAGEINTSMPLYVVTRLAEALNEVAKPVRGSKVGVPKKRLNGIQVCPVI